MVEQAQIPERKRKRRKRPEEEWEKEEWEDEELEDCIYTKAYLWTLCI